MCGFVEMVGWLLVVSGELVTREWKDRNRMAMVERENMAAGEKEVEVKARPGRWRDNGFVHGCCQVADEVAATETAVHVCISLDEACGYRIGSRSQPQGDTSVQVDRWCKRAFYFR